MLFTAEYYNIMPAQRSFLISYNEFSILIYPVSNITDQLGHVSAGELGGTIICYAVRL